MERQLKALANRRRLAILNVLRKRKEANVTQLSDAIKLSFTSTSKHLTMLERLGFIEKRQKSLHVYYRITSAPPPILANILQLF